MNNSLIGKYKSIKYMACIKTFKMHENTILEDKL
jgi:hypothetical protein